MAGSFDRSAILESFLKELHAYFPEIESQLDRVRRQPRDMEALEEIYRRVHTIAGSAAMMDLAGMASIATAMETILSDALDGVAPLNEAVIGLLDRSVKRLKQVTDLTRTGGDERAVVSQDMADHAAVRGRGNGTPASTPLPRAMGGPGAMPMPQGAPQTTPPAWADPRTTPPLRPPIDPAQRTVPLHDVMPQAQVTRLADTPVWGEVVTDEGTVRQSVAALVQTIGSLRDLSRRFDGERNEMLSFLDGSQDALDRLEAWAGQAMGIDLRTSPDHVRRYLPLSVLWVVTARMRQVIDLLNDTTRGLVVQQETIDEAIGHLRQALDRAGQITGALAAAASNNSDGGFTASVAQFSWTPSRASDLAPGSRAEIERSVREELRRELEDEVRAEVASEVRQDSERRLRQELEIQLRRQLLAEISPNLGTDLTLSSGMTMGAPLGGHSATPVPRPYVPPERSQETVQVFRAEAEEHLHTISEGVGRLERSPQDKDATQSVRRAMHTLKGAAAITGFDAVADLAHICEDLLDRMGDDTIKATAEVISLILDTSQALEALIIGDTAEQGGEAGILAAFRPRYQAILGDTVELGTAPKSAKVPASPRQRSALQVVEHADDDIEQDAGAEARAAAAEQAGTSDLSVRLPLRKLDELISLFGDILVNRSVVEERVGRLTRMISDTGVVSERLRDVGGQLERQFEASMMPSQRGAADNGQGRRGGGFFGMRGPSIGGVMSGPNASQNEFDPLELDRYSEFHRISRGLLESVADAGTLSTEMETTIREMEVVLLREGRLSSQFQDALLKARLVPISSLVPRLYRAAQAIAVKYGKEFEMLIEGDDAEIDRSVYEDLVAPLLHLVRNSIYHGIETTQSRRSVGKPSKGQIILSAHYEGNQFVISVRDDGNGMNADSIRATAQARGLIDSYTRLSERELINLIFQPGFSTSETVTEEAGRGIGLDVVRDTVTRLRGTIEVDSIVGQGTTFTMKIPISLQIQRVVLVRTGEQVYAVPMGVVEQLVQLDLYPRSKTSSVPAIEVRGINYPLVHLSTYLTLPAAPITDRTPVLLINSGTHRWGLMVDAVSGRQEIVAKSLGPHLRHVPCISGATVLGNGQVVLIMDPVEMLTRSAPADAVKPTIPPPGTTGNTGMQNRPELLGDSRVSLRPSPTNINRGPASGAGNRNAPYLLVVDDSPSVRRVVSTTLKNAGWDVLTARDGVEAIEVVSQRVPVGILLDIEMPRMDGYELMAALRGQPMYQGIPLIVLTSRAATKHQQRALQLGADAYVVKPYQDEQLLATINELVRVTPTGDPR